MRRAAPISDSVVSVRALDPGFVAAQHIPREWPVLTQVQWDRASVEIIAESARACAQRTLLVVFAVAVQLAAHRGAQVLCHQCWQGEKRRRRFSALTSGVQWGMHCDRAPPALGSSPLFPHRRSHSRSNAIRTGPDTRYSMLKGFATASSCASQHHRSTISAGSVSSTGDRRRSWSV
jgi:hypothetical protein